MNSLFYDTRGSLETMKQCQINDDNNNRQKLVTKMREKGL